MSTFLRFASGACVLIAALIVAKLLHWGVWQAWLLGGIAALVWSGLPLPSVLPPRRR